MNPKNFPKKRGYLIFSGIGILFFFFQMTGRALAVQGNIVWSAGYGLRLLAICVPGGAAAGIAVAFACGKWIGRADRSVSLCSWGWKLWAVSGTLILLCWLPAYLAYYPGICAYDATIQTGQIVEHAYNDHHPIAHTLLIAGGMRLGEVVFGNVNTGIGLLVFLQMTILAGVLAWGIALLGRFGADRRWLVCLQIFCMLYPFHWYMSVSLIKDVLFSAFFFLQMMALCGLIRKRPEKAGRLGVLFWIGSVGMQLFRTNGRYALLVLLLVLGVAFVADKKARRFWGREVISCLTAMVAGSILLAGLFRATGAGQGDRREMLSMPIQQLARCMLYHGGVDVLPGDDAAMEARDRELIRDFLLDESYREYDPSISDPVKRHTNTYVVRYRTADFAKTYLNLLAHYPGDFVNAALAVNTGYFYVGDESHAHVNENGVESGLGYVQTRWVEAELNPRGIYKDSKWESLHEIMEKWADSNAYLKIPLLRYLFVPGIFFWIYLVVAGVLLVRKNYAMCVPLALVFGYYVTLFLGPVVQLRYLYPLMITLPFAALMVLGEDDGRGMAAGGESST